MDRETLARVVERGLTVRQIAAELNCSATTVRRWLRRHGLQTARIARLAATAEARQSGAVSAEAVCPHHGLTTFARAPSGSFRCLRCRSEAVSRRRRVVKETLVAAAGGRCVLCGYARSAAALQFHHIDPIQKEFSISYNGQSRALATVQAEAQKCVLLCATCHAEVEAGIATLPEKLSS